MSTIAISGRPAIDRCPLPALSIAIGLAAIGLFGLTDNWTQRQWLSIVVAGIAVIAGGYEIWRLRWRPIGALFVIVGVGAVVIGFGGTAGAVASISHRLVLIPGTIGLVLLTIALVPISRWYTRGVLMTGFGFVYIGVLVGGILDIASMERILLIGMGIIVAWYSADHGISLGRQVGRDAATGIVTFVQVGGIVLLGIGLVAGTVAIHLLGGIGLSLTALVILLFSSSVIVLAVRH